MTDVYEGSLIRVFRRLEELIRQMAQAAKVMGSEDLEKKFETSLTKVKRGMLLFSRSQGATDRVINLPQTSLLRSHYICRLGSLFWRLCVV